MRRFLILGLLVLGFAVPSLAETAKDLQATIRVRPGNYLVQGRAPDGQTYEGEAQIQSSGPNTWRVAWRVAGATAQGVGLTVGDALVVGYVIDGQVGTVIYGMEPNGHLTGVWTQGPNGGVGGETLIPR